MSLTPEKRGGFGRKLGYYYYYYYYYYYILLLHTTTTYYYNYYNYSGCAIALPPRVLLLSRRLNWP